MLLSKSQLKHPQVDSPPPIKRGKKVLYGSASMMLAFMIGSAPYAVAQDDDSDKNIRGTIQFTKGKYEVPEMAGKAVLCVERRGGNKGGVVAMYGTTSGSAKPGSDYMPMMGHLMWPDGDDSTKPVVIPIKKDKAVEKNKETFYVTLLDMPSMDMDGTMPKDGPPKDDMMMPDMAYCMPKGEMPEGEMMSDGEMMDDMGNPDTVYFGGRFQAKVEIVDNKEPPPPPPGQTKPDKPNQPNQPEQPGDKPDVEGDDDDAPPVLVEDEPPVADEGDQTLVAINTQTFANLFSLKQRIVVKSEGTVVTQRVVIKQTFGVSRKVGVARGRIDIRGRIRSDDNGFSVEDVHGFFDLVESQFPTIEIDREQAIEEGVDVGSLGEILLPLTSGSWASVNPLTIAPAIATSIAEMIVANTGAELVINEDGTVTYVEDGSSVTVTPDVEVTPSDVDGFDVTIDGNTIVVEGNGLSQAFYLQ